MVLRDPMIAHHSDSGKKQAFRRLVNAFQDDAWVRPPFSRAFSSSSAWQIFGSPKNNRSVLVVTAPAGAAKALQATGEVWHVCHMPLPGTFPTCPASLFRSAIELAAASAGRRRGHGRRKWASFR
jgi:hypothetical protein